MRNTGKGLIVGGLTGAAPGLVLASLHWGAEAPGTLGARVNAPEAASKLHASFGGGVSENVARVQAVNIHDRLGM